MKATPTPTFWKALRTVDPFLLTPELAKQPDLTATQQEGLTALEVVLLAADTADELDMSDSLYEDGRWRVLAMLLDKGAPVNVPRDRNGTSLFRHALQTHLGEQMDKGGEPSFCLTQVGGWLDRVAKDVPRESWEADLADAWGMCWPRHS